MMTLRRFLAHYRKWSRRPQDEGFTLVELLVVLVVLPLLLGALASLIISLLANTVPNSPHGVATRLADSHDAQNTTAFFNRDVQGAKYVTAYADTALCQGTNSGKQLLGIEWTSGSNTIDVSYFVQGATLQSPIELVRNYCSSTSAPASYPVTAASSVVIADNVFTNVTSVKTGSSSVAGNCDSALGSGATTCVTDTSSGTTYMAETVNCFKGATDVACPTSVSTTAPSSGSPGLLVHPLSSGDYGIKNIVVQTQEKVSAFQYFLTGTPRVTNTSASFSNLSGGSFPSLIVNGSMSGGNCNITVNGAAAVNSTSDGSITNSPTGSITATQAIFTSDPNPSSGTSGATKGSQGTISPTPTYGTPVTSPYAGLSAPTSANIPATAQYPIVTETANSWDPTTDSVVVGGITYQTTVNGVLNQTLYPHGAIFVIQHGLTISKAFSAPQGALFYVTGNDSAGASANLNGNANLFVNPLVPVFESPTQPLPELVLWDIATGSMTIGGNGNTTVLNGAVYAPNASTITLNGGGNSGGLTAAALNLGGTISCNGQDAVTVGSGGAWYSLASVQPSTTSGTTGTALNANVTVYGTGTSSPTGSVSIYWCGPSAGAGCGQTTGWTATAADLVATKTLTAGSNNTATASANYTPTVPGSYCFAVIYAGDSKYNGSSDSSSDGCFTVTASMPAPVITVPGSTCYFTNTGNVNCLLPWPGSFSGNATDLVSTIDHVYLQISSGTKYWSGSAWTTTATWVPVTLGTTTAGTTQWTYAFPNQNWINGSNTYSVTAYSHDTAGDSSSDTTPVSFKVKN